MGVRDVSHKATADSEQMFHVKHSEGRAQSRDCSGRTRSSGCERCPRSSDHEGRMRSHGRSGRLIIFDAGGAGCGLGADGEGRRAGLDGRSRAANCRRDVADGEVGGGADGGNGADSGEEGVFEKAAEKHAWGAGDARGEGGEGAFAEGFGAEDVLFSATPLVKPCTGCFGCWTRTPGVCVLRDRCTEMPRLMARCDTLVLVSPFVYGGFSRAVKAVLDRAIGYVQPFFRTVEGEMHHVPRYEDGFRLEAHFYGPSSEPEREVARRLVRANAVNYYATSFDVRFHENLGEAKEALR